MSTNSKLPLTHYDHVKKIRPALWDYLTQEIEHLREMGWQGAVSSVDDIDSQAYTPCMTALTQQFFESVAASSGCSLDDVIATTKGTPQLRMLLETLNQDYHSLLNFELAGKKTFYFSNNLTDHLLATEINIDAELVRPPFDSSLFVFSSPSAIEAAYQACQQKPEPDAYRYPLFVFVTSLADRGDPDNSRRIMMNVSHWRGKHWDIGLKREVAIRAGWKLDDALRTEWASLEEGRREGFRASIAGCASPVTDEEFYTDGLSFFRLVLNAVLYLGSSDPEVVQRLSGRAAALARAEAITSSVKAKKARQEARKESELDYASVGDSVPPIHVRKGETQQATGPMSGSGTLEYAKRFIVRGHWRNQPCGPALAERKIIWVKPYYKGPEVADLVNRPYVVS